MYSIYMFINEANKNKKKVEIEKFYKYMELNS